MGDSVGDISQLQVALRKEKPEASRETLETSIRMMFERDAETNSP